MRSWLLAAIISLSLGLIGATQASASPALKIQPLIYEEAIEKGEIKKGFIDISNPSQQKLNLVTSVEAFRQVDDKGNIEFYDSDEVEAGIKLDYDKFSLEPRGAMRLVFQVDGSKLPTGDVFAAIFISTDSSQASTIEQNIRVGTLLILSNGTPSSHEATISGLSAPIFVFDGKINGSYTIKNQAKLGQATGFRPEVTIRLAPFGKTVAQKGPLVFAGRERSANFTLPSSLVGVYQLTVSTEGSQQSRLVFLMPAWSLLVLAGLICIGFVYWRWRSQRGQRRRFDRSRTRVKRRR